VLDLTVPGESGRRSNDNYLSERDEEEGEGAGVVGGGSEGEYTVPTPIYPSLTRTNVLTKSDIISMYCRER
jgi:hypothetical protein